MIPATKFCEKYNISTANIYAHHHNNVASWITKKDGNLFVDEEYLLHIQAERKRLWLLAHDYYFYFTYVLDVKPYTLAKSIAKKTNGSRHNWSTYLSESLFSPIVASFLNTTIAKYLTQFIAVCEEMIPTIHKKLRHDKEYQLRLKDME